MGGNDDNMSGWIKLYSDFANWEWYKDTITKTVFLHCLLKANWKNGKFEGTEIPRGSFVTSYKNLSDELSSKKQKIGIQSIRTALNHLVSTKELTIKTTSKFTIITVNNYDLYQTSNTVSNSQLTHDQHATNTQLTTIEDICSYVCSYLERIRARTITSFEYEQIEVLVKEYSKDLIIYAIDVATLNNKLALNYIIGILRNWKNSGFKTKQDVLNSEKKIKEERDKPCEELFDYDWLNEESE